MPRYKITVTATSTMEFDASEFADDGEPAPEGSELHECIESDIADKLHDFVDNADDFSIQIEPIESPTSESL